MTKGPKVGDEGMSGNSFEWLCSEAMVYDQLKCLGMTLGA